MRGAPITLYRNGESRTVFPIDLQGSLDDGWSQDPETVVEEVTPDPDKPEGKRPGRRIGSRRRRRCSNDRSPSRFLTR